MLKVTTVELRVKIHVTILMSLKLINVTTTESHHFKC